MSGIVGVFSQKRRIKKEIIEKMTASLKQRGPDEQRVYLKEEISLGVSRFSAIGLDNAAQPIFNETKEIVLICDGEIYNFNELKDELETKGKTFRTSSDLEVIIHLYEAKGIDFLNDLRGVFSLALWDGRKKHLYLARDRIGTKPLYYFENGELLAFASLPRPLFYCPGIPKTLDLSALDHYLTFEYIPGESCIFKYIRKLLPGHYLLYREGNLEVREYWQLDFCSRRHKNKKMLMEEVKKVLEESVKLNLLSDVPLGVLLSGGLDSSTIVALMSGLGRESIRTFSIGFEDKSYNELDYARLVSRHFKTEHHDLIISSQTAVDLARELPKVLDEPLADTSIIPSFLAFRLAKDYVKVVLCGDGGDELLAGYDTYLAQKFSRYCRWFPNFIKTNLAKLPPKDKKKGLMNRLRRFSQGLEGPAEIKHLRWMGAFNALDKKSLYSDYLMDELDKMDSYEVIRRIFSQVRDKSWLNQLQYVDLKTYLPDAGLVKTDRMAMLNAMQARYPFLDNKVVTLLTKLHPRLKIRGAGTKYILKETMKEILPKEIINKRKEGFSSPLKNWLRGGLKITALNLLSGENIKRRGLFNENYIRTMLNEHFDRRKDNSHQLWALIVFELWAEEWLDKE